MLWKKETILNLTIKRMWNHLPWKAKETSLVYDPLYIEIIKEKLNCKFLNKNYEKKDMKWYNVNRNYKATMY